MNPTPTSQALRRAEVIVQVRAGLLTATAGAARLGISRKSYYQWEARALRALLASQECGPTGRPRKARQDPEKAELQRRIARLERNEALMTAAAGLRESLAASRPNHAPTPLPAAGREKKRKP